MHQSKLVDLFQALTAQQLRRCDSLLPAFVPDKNSDISRLYQYLRSTGGHFNEKKLAKKVVAKALNLSEKNLAYRSSELLQILGQCLVVDQVLANPIEQELQLMQVFLKKGLGKNYQSAARRVQKQLEDYPYRDADYLEYRYRFFEMEQRMQANYERKHRPEIQAASDALDKAYLGTKLRYLLQMTSAGQVLDIPYEKHLADAVKHWSLEAPFNSVLLIRLYRKVLMMVEEPETGNHFQSVKTLLKETEKLLPHDLFKNFYLYLLNYCTHRITRHNDTRYYERYLNLNVELIEKGMLLEEGFLPPWRFSNLTTVGLRTGRLEWTRHFLENYQKYLPPDQSANIYAYNNAHCLYYEKDYDEALLLLSQLDLHDPLLAIAAKNLLVKVFWEADQTESLLRHLENYRLYIYRQPLAKPKLKEQVKCFITYVRKMAKTPVFEREKRQKLANSLPPATEILEHEWLQLQLKQFLNKKS